MKCFILVIESEPGLRERIQQYLDTRPEILNWFAFLPTALALVSRQTPAYIAQLLRGQFPGKRFVIVEAHRQLTDGWAPRELWNFVTDPKSSGLWEPVNLPAPPLLASILPPPKK